MKALFQRVQLYVCITCGQEILHYTMSQSEFDIAKREFGRSNRSLCQSLHQS